MPHKNRETRLAYLKAWRNSHKEYRKIQRPFYECARHANAKVRRYGAHGVITGTDVKKILHPGAKCYYCGRSGNELPIIWGKQRLGIDHIIPLCYKGPNILENIVACCHPCNASKWRGKHPYQWARLYDRCQGCGTTIRKHSARGFCGRCYQARFKKTGRLYGQSVSQISRQTH